MKSKGIQQVLFFQCAVINLSSILSSCYHISQLFYDKGFSMQPGTMDVCKNGERPPGKLAESQCDGDILTFSNGERRVGEVEPHQLS